MISGIVNVGGQFSHEIICGKALTLPLSLTLTREPVLSSAFHTSVSGLDLVMVTAETVR